MIHYSYILKSQSQVGIRAGRSRSGFYLIWSVTVVRGCSLLVTAAVRDCPSSFNLVSELPNTVKQHFNIVCHCLQSSATVCRRSPPSAAVHWCSSVRKPPDLNRLSARQPTPPMSQATPSPRASTRVISVRCSQARAAFQSPVRRRTTSVAVVGASSNRFDPQISVPVMSSSTSCGNRHFQIRKSSLFHYFPRSSLFLFILLIISWPLEVLGVLFHSPEAPALRPRN